MNGVLFLALLVLLRPTARSSQTAVLSQANAYAADSSEASTPQLGDRQYLNYQQWVELLRQEAEFAARANLENQTLLLGDSLSLWFPPDLLPGRRSWLNQAISGENSNGLLLRLPLLDANNPDIIFIMIGINDLIWGKTDAELLDNAEAIVEYLRQMHPNTQIVVQSILPHGGADATWEGRERLLVLSPQRLQRVNAALAAIAASYRVDFLDLHPLFVNGEGNLRQDLTTDGLHLNRQGYLVWRTALAIFTQED